jgi:hypothetical protein
LILFWDNNMTALKKLEALIDDPRVKCVLPAIAIAQAAIALSEIAEQLNAKPTTETKDSE